MSWRRRLLPGTLRGRLILLILGAVFLAQALTLYAFAVHQKNQIQTAAVNLLVTSIQTVRAALERVDPEARSQFVEQVSHGQWKLVSRGLPRHARFQSERGLEPASEADAHLRRSLRAMAKEVNRALGKGFRVAVTSGEQPYLYVSIRDTDGLSNRSKKSGQWLQIALDRVDPPLTTKLLAAWLASLGALLLVVVGFSWHITRPLTQLVQATDRLAAGTPQPVSPAGPVEVRRLGEKFNDMLATLAQAERTQRTLLAGLPHDLKGPLARMALRIEMSEDEALKAGLKRDLHEMQKMVEQFLAYLRGRDHNVLQRHDIRMDEWLVQRVEEMQRLGQEVVLDGALTQVTISADVHGLDRVLTNLVDNALEHGVPPIRVALTTQDHFVVLTVSDQGAGIRAEDQARVLEPFERLDQARTRTGHAGLGLSIVHLIVLAHQGQLHMRQMADGGFAVDVRLPYRDIANNRERA